MTETTSPRQQIEDLAPYPDWPDASEYLLARYFTVQGFASFCRLSNHPCWQVPEERDEQGKPAGAYAAGLRGYVRDAELAWTLAVAATLLRDKAGTVEEETLAGILGRGEDSAEVASETLGGWLIGYGIDAEVIVRAVRAEQGLTP